MTIDDVLAADYDYDANGNRLSKWTPSGTEAGTYDDQDRMLTYSGSSFTYTRNGELATRTDGAVTTSFHYDVFGILLQIDPPGAWVIDYVVDARNRRIGKKVNGAWEKKLLWQGQLAPAAELTGTNAVLSRFVYATRANVPDFMRRTGETFRILTDHLGSPGS